MSWTGSPMRYWTCKPELIGRPTAFIDRIPAWRRRKWTVRPGDMLVGVAKPSPEAVDDVERNGMPGSGG